MSIKNRILTKHFHILKNYEFSIRKKFVANRVYSVQGSSNGTLTLFADKMWSFQGKNRSNHKLYGEWLCFAGEIKIFDHWLLTIDNGQTFVSHLDRLELIYSNFDFDFGSCGSQDFDNARNAYEAPRFESRDNDFLEWIPKGGVVAELGVETGSYAKKIFEVTRPKEFHLVDVWDSIIDPWPSREKQAENYKQILRNFENDINKGRIIVHKGDDISYLQSLPDKYLDWVYIDSSHAYEHTLKELMMSDRKLKSNGFICGHDFVDNEFGRRSGFGVIKAVYQFINTSDWQLIYLTKDKESTFVLKRKNVI